jgi:hypothetical protein
MQMTSRSVLEMRSASVRDEVAECVWEGVEEQATRVATAAVSCVAGCCRMRVRVSVVEHAAVDAFGLCCTSGRADKNPAGREEEDDGVGECSRGTCDDQSYWLLDCIPVVAICVCHLLITAIKHQAQ